MQTRELFLENKIKAQISFIAQNKHKRSSKYFVEAPKMSYLIVVRNQVEYLMKESISLGEWHGLVVNISAFHSGDPGPIPHFLKFFGQLQK